MNYRGEPSCSRAFSRTRFHEHGVLYLHGTQDGCLGADLVKDASSHLPPGSRAEQVAGAGHFLHLERPEEVNRLILDWLGPA